MKYFATIQEQRQDLNYGTNLSPKFGMVKGGWVFECQDKEEIESSIFTPGELIEFNTKEEAKSFLEKECDKRFIDFASYEYLKTMTP